MPLNMLEKEAIKDFREGKMPNENLNVTEKNLLKVSFYVVLQISQLLEKARKSEQKNAISVTYKSDGTRSASVDVNTELMAQRIIRESFVSHNFIGEETGGTMKSHGYIWALDPNDSTNTYLTHETVSAVSLALFKDNEVMLGIVSNPSTGELFYTLNNQNSRLISAAGFSPYIYAQNLPLPPIESIKNQPSFANVHPVRRNDIYYTKMLNAARSNKLDKIIQMGGSPAYEMACVTKGHYSFIHDWLKPSDPWDLAASIAIVRNTPGGRVTDLENNDIPHYKNKGPLVATVGEEFHKKILKILRG